MENAARVFESLSSNIRLDIYRLLVKEGPQGMVAGHIASKLDIAPSNLSFHLKELVSTKLLWVEQEGRFLRYRANVSLILDLIAYLTEQCCNGDLSQCLPQQVISSTQRKSS